MGIFFDGIFWFLVDLIRISPKDALLLWEVTIKSTGPLEANHCLLFFILGHVWMHKKTIYYII